MNLIQKKAIIFFGDEVSIYLADSTGFSYQRLHYWGSKCDRAKILQDISVCGISSFGIVNQGDREDLKTFVGELLKNRLSILCIQDSYSLLQKFLRGLGLENGFFLDWGEGLFTLYNFCGETKSIEMVWPAPLTEFSTYIEQSMGKLLAGNKLLLSGSLSLLWRNLGASEQFNRTQSLETDKQILYCPPGMESAIGILCRELSRLPEYERSLFSTVFLSKIASLGLVFFLMFFLSGFFSPSPADGLRVTEILQLVNDNFITKDEQKQLLTANIQPDISYCGLTEDGSENCGQFLYLGQKIQLCAGFASGRLQVKNITSDKALLLINGYETLLQKMDKVKTGRFEEKFEAGNLEKTSAYSGLTIGFSVDGQRHVRVIRDLPFWNLRSGDKIKSFHNYDLYRPSDLKLFNILAENSYPLSGFDIL